MILISRETWSIFKFPIDFISLDINSPIFSGDNSIEGTPDPIPNSAVKLYSADGTARETSVEE